MSRVIIKKKRNNEVENNIIEKIKLQQTKL